MLKRLFFSKKKNVKKINNWRGERKQVIFFVKISLDLSLFWLYKATTGLHFFPQPKIKEIHIGVARAMFIPNDFVARAMFIYSLSLK